MFQFIDLGDPKLQEKVMGIPPVDGFCLMVDIVGSTAMKNQGKMPEWVLRIRIYELAAFNPIGDDWHGS